MSASKIFLRTLFLLGASCFFASSLFAATATISNPSFSTYIAAADSFASWSADKDPTGLKFTITQETADAYSAPGCLKMTIAPGADTLTECRISGSITGLTEKKIVTISAMVKFIDVPTYWHAMFNLQQATLTPGTWAWQDRRWRSGWGNGTTTSEWTTASMTDTTADSANVFNFIISLSKAGTLLVDDITVTYSDLAPVLPTLTKKTRQTAFRNNRISFSRQTPFTQKICGINGKILLQRSGTAAVIDMNRLNLSSGAYLVSVTTPDQVFSGRVMIGK